MIPHDVLMSVKVAMLEGLVRDIFVDRFNSMPDPLASAKEYAEARVKPRPGAVIDPLMEPTRETVLQTFLDSVVAGVHR